MEKVEVNSQRWLSLEDLEGEIWKPTEFPHYAISNYGRLKGLEYSDLVVRKVGKPFMSHYKEHICKLGKTRCGYLSFRVSVNKKLKNVYPHQLVAKAFIPNPNNLPFINHKNEDKSDNRVENLHFCTAKFNSNYGTCQKRRATSLKKVMANRETDICQYTLNGELIKKYETMGDITDAGFCIKTVLRCCRHRQKTADGYVWLFSEEPFRKPEFTDTKGGTIRHKVQCFTLEGNLVATYENLKEAATAMGGLSKRPAISTCIHGGLDSAFGYKWKNAND